MSEQEVHGYYPDTYVDATEPLIRKRLEWFKDQKYALMSHFGPYNHLGMCESWPLCDEDDIKSWAKYGIDWTNDNEQFKRDYINLSRSFYPIKMVPQKWADAAKDAGMRYFILTTKHHDGFCLWDTKYSNYKVTDKSCAFSSSEYADICRHMFSAFRKNKIAVAAYFSKADWHHPDYWDDCGVGIKTTRNPTYDTSSDPQRWERFAKYTQNQILELMKNYGRIDILWLDAGQVNRRNKQDIHIEEIVRKAREIQPWLLSADRTIGGECENYITPEQTVPDKPLLVPWESCITMGSAFSYRYDDTYKSPRTIIRLLCDIVAKGGNLALNVAPQPNGDLPAPAYKNLKEVGEWLNENGEAIYGTRIAAPFKKGEYVFTKKYGNVYAIRMYEESSDKMRVTVPISRSELSCEAKGLVHVPTRTKLEFTHSDTEITAVMPEGIKLNNIADAFKILM